MASPSKGFADLLVAAGIGAFNANTGWSITVSQLPDRPDSCITFFDIGGISPNPKFLLDQPSVQMMIRGNENGYEAAYAKAIAARNALLGIPAQIVNGDRWDGILQVGGLAFVNYDQKKRPMISVNFRVFLEPATGTYREPL